MSALPESDALLEKHENNARAALLLSAIQRAHGLATGISLDSPDHGPRHWRDVARIGLWLVTDEQSAEIDPELVLLFAALHDTRRLDEFEDPGHGARAAHILGKYIAPMLDLGPERAATLAYALTAHDNGLVSSNPTVGVCWDADRLTLYRVGIEPHADLLSTRGAKRVPGDAAAAETTRQLMAGPDRDWGEIVYAYIEEAPFDLIGKVVNLELPLKERRSLAMTSAAFAPEELCDELKACLHESEDGRYGLYHPLVHEASLYSVHLHRRYNRTLEAKQHAVQEAFAEHQWATYIWLHERPYRAQALSDVYDEILRDISPNHWGEIVSSIWSDSENIWENVDTWRDIFHGMPYGTLCDTEALEKLEAMPDELTIYRGTCAPDQAGSGLSWTLDRGKAVWFARRFANLDGHTGAPVLLTGTVSKADVLGYLTDRGEDEIIPMLDAVTITTTEEVT